MTCLGVSFRWCDNALLVSGEELSSHKSNGHDFSGRELLGLGIVFMSERSEQFIEEAVKRYNLFRHGRLRQRGLGNFTLPISLHGLHNVATWIYFISLGRSAF